MSSSSPASVVDLQSHLQLYQRHGRTASRTRFYAHRVRESLANRVVMFLCSVLLTLLLIAGIIVLVLWLSFRPHRPRFYLSSFSAPSLNAFSFTLSDRNPNAKIAISYGDISAAVFYDNRQLASGTVLSAFYQPPKNTTEIHGQLGRVAVRIELTAAIRFTLSAWDTRDHRLHVNCDFAVGPDGNLLLEFQGESCSRYFG
ncbi:hypothetical protein KSP40_PGU019465 [Platanthera guangdongensis]|uniref:Late embryogenesis abundant protein LEA-2 subgroup domain-containing protein n=1 Tax=Platanthera guangdongensis TaxID=2320717 RepID=A0ABR2MXF5_9ASPA